VVYFNPDCDVKRWEEHIKRNRLEGWINVSKRTKILDSKIAKLYFAVSILTYDIISNI
jgi:hypothetical protein